MMTNPNPSKEMQRPPMFLFLVIKIGLMFTSMAVVMGILLQSWGLPPWASFFISGGLAWYVSSKYDEILIEIADYLREKK